MPFVVGLNHRTAPLAARERFNVGAQGLPEALERLSAAAAVEELVIVSTCNRFEVYARAHDRLMGRRALIQSLESWHGGPLDPEMLYALDGEEAVRHLFRVASGLDSMVHGEHEVLGQVKQAYLAAHETGLTGKLLNVLFQRSLYVGKRVRSETGLSIGSASVAAVAVQLAERIFGTLESRQALVFGAGTMADAVIRHLQSQKVGSVFIANRTFEHAVSLAQTCKGAALTWDAGIQQMAHADIVIGSVAAPEPVISAAMVDQVLQSRRDRSLFLIDIAVPRCIDPASHHLPNCYLFDMDDLQKIVDANQARREAEVHKAESIIAEETKEFSRWLAAHRAGLRRGLRHEPAAARPVLAPREGEHA